MPAAFAAILVSVFFTTAYVAFSLIDCRSVLSWATVSPRYSVSRTADELRNRSVISATDASLFAMVLPNGWMSAKDHRGMKNAPANKGHGAEELLHTPALDFYL